MESSSSRKSRLNESKRPKINNGSGTRAVPSTLTTRPSTSSVTPYVPTHGTKICISALSPSTPARMGPSTSNTIRPSTPSMVPSTTIPEIYNEDACYQVCNHKIEIDLSDFCDKNSESACGVLTVSGKEGATHLFYILLKDAIDASVEVKFETMTPGREVRGYVIAYYGDDFLTECQCPPAVKYNYMSILFLPNHVLKNGVIQLINSLLAVPTKGSLVIRAYLEDVNSREVIMKNSCKFKSQPFGCSSFGIISGTDCQFDLKVDWKYQA